MDARIAICLLVCAFYQVNADVDIITEPRQGQEYVLVSSGQQTSLRNFETSHKIPEKHPNHRVLKDDGVEKIIKKIHSGKPRHPTEGIVSIEEDKKATFKKGQKLKSDSIEIDIPVSKLKDIKIKEYVEDVETNPKMAVALEAMSESGKLTSSSGTTTQKPVLTTAPPAPAKGFDYIPINFDTIDDINSGLLSSNVQLETAGSEQKQHSRIQIKKGPNGQDYEYEYIYYYYDEEEGGKKESKEKSSSTAAPSVHNSHDGPQKVETENQIPKEKNRNRYSTIDRTTTTAATPENQNEVLPATTTSRGRQRGRNLTPAPVEEEIEEDRLPSSTRFPPRSRNLAAATTTTTAAPEASSETVRHRGRPQIDNIADESSGQTRSRTRAHIRRPSSELVDLDSFKTHSEDIPSQYKEQPSRYSSESKTTTSLPEVEASPIAKEELNAKENVREGHSLPTGVIFQEILDDSKLPADYKQTTTYEQDTTEYTTMTAMEKVALDLYAYLAGENLNNEINPTSDMSVDGSTTDDSGWTTESMSTTVEATTPTTTAEPTTTTTTPAPTTTTTTTAAPTRPSRFKGRPGARARISTTPTAATEAPQQTSTRVRGRFSKPGARKTTAATAVDATPEPVAAEKPVAPPKQAFGRRGLYAARTRPSSTTAAPAPEDTNAAPSDTPAPSSRPRLRPTLRRTTTTSTAAPAAEEEPSSNGSEESAETTPAPTRTLGRTRPGLRPASLRPGARLNLRPGARSRPGAATVDAPEAAGETPAPEAPSTDAEAEASSPTPAPEANPRLRLRNRLQVSPSPKPKVAATTPPRRINPLLKRKQPSTEATTEAAKKASSETTEETTSAEKSETETDEVPAETTPAPQLRGLDALFARRRAAAGGVGGRPVRPARGARYPK